MKKIKYIILCFTFAFFLSGCITPTLTNSNKADDYYKKINRLTIIYLGNKFGADESAIKPSEFYKLSVPFTDAGIKTDLFFYSGLDLNSSAHLDYYIGKNPYVLILNPTVMTTGDARNVTYNLSLYDKALNHKVWVANLFVPEGWVTSIFQRYEEMGNVILNKLTLDGLISQTPKKKR